MQLLVVLLIGESLTRINSCSIYMQRELGNSSQSHNSPLHFVTAHRNLVQKYGGKLFTHQHRTRLGSRLDRRKHRLYIFIDADPKKHNLEPDPRFQLLGSTATLKYLRVFICSFHVNFKKINLMICFCLTVQCLFYIK